MISTKHFPTSNHKNSEACFLPSMFSGTAGIIIGLAIGYVLGWV
ncbi:MAG: hypothetical protein QNJ72_31735 [Pleurocapsa sp. MO_226.B13]|nr:hypothetical protein [Pleurocapsa sp. MO_226.B13]